MSTRAIFFVRRNLGKRQTLGWIGRLIEPPRIFHYDLDHTVAAVVLLVSLISFLELKVLPIHIVFRDCSQRSRDPLTRYWQHVLLSQPYSHVA